MRIVLTAQALRCFEKSQTQLMCSIESHEENQVWIEKELVVYLIRICVLL